MRSKLNFGLTLLVAVLALCSFAPQVKADNEGDWTPTYKAQWWWKYVHPQYVGVEVVAVNVVEVRSDRAGYLAQKVVFTVANRSRVDYKGGDLYSVGHMFSAGELVPARGPAAFRPTDMSRGYLPAVQAGASIHIALIAYTPEKGSFDDFNHLTIGQ